MRQANVFCLGLVTAFLGCGSEAEKEREGPGSFVAAQVRGEVHPGDVAMDPEGRFLVVWGDDRDGLPRLWARLYDAGGKPLTAEMRVSSTDMETGYASVRMGPDGQSIVAFSAEDGWHEYDSRVRRFDAEGRPIGEDLVVFRDSVRPDVELLPDGGFVVTDTVRVDAQRSYSLDPSRFEARVRRFNPDGQLVGPERILEDYPRSTLVNAANPRIQRTPSGGYSVVWDTQVEAPAATVGQVPYLGAFSLHFDLDGSASRQLALRFAPPPGIAELRSQQNHFVNLPDGSVALLARGFAGGQSTGAQRQRAGLQLLTAAGEPLGAAFELHSRPEAADILGQDLALLGCGAASGCLLLATWISVPVDQPSEAIVYARVFDTAGRPRSSPLAPDGAEFSLGRVSNYSAYPYVGGNARGDLVLVWRKTGDTGSPDLEQIDGLFYPRFAEAVQP